MAIVAVGSNSPPPQVRGNRRQFCWQSPDRPAPTIRARTLGGYGGSELVQDDGKPEEVRVNGKPEYRVPTMTEIRKRNPNGLLAASTFSGCGGSSLGYRMDGFRVGYASEFVEAARETYLANAEAYTYVDPLDIREVTAEDVLRHLGITAGELDLLDGSPPCASFSTSGKRSDGWGKVKKYSDRQQRTDDLFYEFARILEGVQPKVFVAENVSGLVKGTAKGYFIRIMTRLREAGYRVDAKLLDAQWLGVPQARQRLIFVGVRNDLKRAPAFPAPLRYRYAVREVLGDAGRRYVHDTSGDRSGGDFTGKPSPTVTVGVNSVNSLHYRVIAQGANAEFGTGAVRPANVPSGTIGASPQTGNGRTPPSLVVADGPLTHDPETGKDLRIPSASRYAREFMRPGAIARKLSLGELRRICGFPDDFVLTGTYEQRWERLGRAVPPVMMSHIARAVRTKILETL